MSGCGVSGCERPGPFKKGFCESHYRRFLRYGNPTAGRPIRGEPFAYLLAHVGHSGEECLIWPYGRTTGGYGTTTVMGKLEYVHRLMCAMTHGEPSNPNIQARHLCGNGDKGCFNPRHLAWGTRSMNQMDRISHGTSNRGARHPMNILTEKQVLEIYTTEGPNIQVLSKRYGVHSRTILDILQGRSWSWLTMGV